MAHAGKDHGNAMLIGGGYNFVVAHTAAGLNNGADTHLGGLIQAITEGQEGLRGHRRAGDLQPLILCLDVRNNGAVDPAHLPCTDAGGEAVFGVDDGIGFNELGHFPGK